MTALATNKLEILDNPPMIEYFGRMDTVAVRNIIISLYNYRTNSPIVAGFFLSCVKIPVNTGRAVYDYRIDQLIRTGMRSMIQVLMKHDLVKSFDVVDGAAYIRYSDTDDNYDKSWTPLWLASKLGKAEIVKLFLKVLPADAEVDGQNFDLSWPIEHNDEEIVRLLLETGWVPTDEVRTSISDATRNGRSRMVDLLMPYIDDEEAYDFSETLEYAVINDYTDIVLRLLKYPKLHLDSRRRSNLMSFAKYNGNDTVERALRLHD